MIGLMGLAAGQVITGTVTVVGRGLIGCGTMLTAEVRPGDRLVTVNEPRRMVTVDVPLTATHALLCSGCDEPIDAESVMIEAKGIDDLELSMADLPEGA